MTDERPDDDEWVQAYLEAMRLDSEAADRELARLAETAPTEEQARDMQFERARLALQRDDIELARQRFEQLWDDDPDDAVGSRSLYELARMAYEQDDDPQRARQLATQAILETPPWAGAELALKFYLLDARRSERFDEAAAELAAMAEQSDDDRMASQLHLERGLILDERLDRPDDALQSYRAAHRRCDDCAATDEALFQMGQIYARHLQWDSAARAYQQVAGRTAPSMGVGTYHSQRAADARYELALLELLFRDDHEAAIRNFRQLQRDFPDHRLSEDVAWHLVEIERLHGTERSYRRALQSFIDDYPRSRRAATAQQRLGEAT